MALSRIPQPPQNQLTAKLAIPSPQGELRNWEPGLRDSVTYWLMNNWYGDDIAGREKAERLVNVADVTKIGDFLTADDIVRAAESGNVQAMGAGVVGAVLGNKLGKALFKRVDPNVLGTMGGPLTKKPIEAYHASPHDFDRFDLNKIGTGEGAQVYGHGLYFAENPKVAEHYYNQFKELNSTPHFTLGGATFYSPWSAADAAFGFTKTPTTPLSKTTLVTALDALKAGVPKATILDRITNGLDPATAERFGGSVIGPTERASLNEAYKKFQDIEFREGRKPVRYQVELGLSSEELLHWDRPIYGQSKQVEDILRKELRTRDKVAIDNALGDSGGDIMHAMARLPGGQAKAAQRLKEAGIPGVRYYEGASRYKSAQDIALHLLDLSGGDKTKALANAEKRLLGPDIKQSELEEVINNPDYAKLSLVQAIKQLRDPKFVDPRQHNYVTFRDDVIKIIRKYGLAGLMTGGALDAAMEQQDGSKNRNTR
jgi:hypothetical protein